MDMFDIDSISLNRELLESAIDKVSIEQFKQVQEMLSSLVISSDDELTDDLVNLITNIEKYENVSEVVIETLRRNLIYNLKNRGLTLNLDIYIPSITLANINRILFSLKWIDEDIKEVFEHIMRNSEESQISNLSSLLSEFMKEDKLKIYSYIEDLDLKLLEKVENDLKPIGLEEEYSERNIIVGEIIKTLPKSKLIENLKNIHLTNSFSFYVRNYSEYLTTPVDVSVALLLGSDSVVNMEEYLDAWIDHIEEDKQDEFVKEVLEYISKINNMLEEYNSKVNIGKRE